MKRCAAECENADDLDNNYLNCIRCMDSYHYHCLNISPEHVVSLTPENKGSWSCPKCIGKQPKGGNANLPVRPSTPTSMADITFNVTRRKVQQKPEPLQSFSASSDYVTRSELRDLIREEMRSAVRECIVEMSSSLDIKLRDIREQITSFKDTMQFLSAQYDSMHKNYEESHSELRNIKKENESLRAECKNQSVKLSQMDQLSRASNLEIMCVPEGKSENVLSIVKELCRAVKYNLNEDSIHHCARTAKMNPTSTRPRSILVKLNSPRTRDSLLAAVACHNKKHPQAKLNTSDLGLGNNAPIYVVENLSPEYKALHAAARHRGKQLEYKFVWVRGGRIYMKKSESSDTIFIRSHDSLDNLR